MTSSQESSTGIRFSETPADLALLSRHERSTRRRDPHQQSPPVRLRWRRRWRRHGAAALAHSGNARQGDARRKQLQECRDTLDGRREHGLHVLEARREHRGPLAERADQFLSADRLSRRRLDEHRAHRQEQRPVARSRRHPAPALGALQGSGRDHHRHRARRSQRSHVDSWRPGVPAHHHRLGPEDRAWRGAVGHREFHRPGASHPRGHLRLHGNRERGIQLRPGHR